MHSEYVEGLVLRPLMDAGYTAWRDGRRVGIARYVDRGLEVEADDLRTRTALVERLTADLRAAGIMARCESSSPGRPAQSGGRSSGSSSPRGTRSAA
jgi:hypothetical protein